MALPHNRPGVRKLLAKLEPMILGATRPEISCNCGAIHNGPATAVSINPAGDQYPGYEVHWHLWTVTMSETPQIQGSHHYSYSLSEFVDSRELEMFFREAFGKNPDDKNPYEPEVTSKQRYEQFIEPRMTAAVKPDMLIIELDFGLAQWQARTLYQIYETSEKFIWNSDVRFAEVIDRIERLQAIIEIGGPEPELPTEPHWLTTIAEIVNLARHHNRLHFLNLLSTSNGDGNRVVYQMGVVFITPA